MGSATSRWGSPSRRSRAGAPAPQPPRTWPRASGTVVAPRRSSSSSTNRRRDFTSPTSNAVGVFDKLIKAGHAVLVIEHNLDVLDCADHVIEMGPGEGRRRRSGRLHGHARPDVRRRHAHRHGARRLAARACGDATRESFFNLPPLKRSANPSASRRSRPARWAAR